MIFLKRRALMTRASFNYKTVSGIGSIVLENCVETRFKRLVLSGNSKQTSTKGLQLLDIAKIPTPQAGLSYYNMQVEEGKYTLSTKYRRAVQKDLFLLAGEVNTGASSNVNGVDSTISRTVESINGYITIGYRNGENGVNPLDFETMLNMGETPLPYEPYTGGKPSPSVEYPQEIVSAGDDGQIDVKVTSKNLFDISKNKYKCDEEKICIPSKPLGEINITNGITFEEKTAYSLSWESYTITKPNSDWSPIFGVKYTDGINEEFYMHFYKSGTKTNANKTIGYVYIRNPWSVGTEVNRIQIEKGTGRTEYEPFKLQTLTIPLDRLITKWDRIEKRDGVWGIARQSVREELTQYNFDTYILPSGSYPTGVYCYATKKSNAVLENQSSFCTHFKNSNYAYSITNAKVGIYSDHGRVPYKYFVSDKPTVDEFKAWLVQQKEAGTPVELVYKTAEETWEPLPEETQLALENLHANDGTTIITVDSGEVETGIEVEYAIKN